MRGRDLWRIALLGLVALALLGTLGYLIALAAGDRQLAEIISVPGPSTDAALDRYEVLPWLIVAAVAGLGALAGWLWSERRAALGDPALRREVERERERADQLERQRQVQTEWNRELRRHLHELHQKQGPLGGIDDVRQLVLRIAIVLTNSEKGLLLSHNDADRDGDLDLVASEGFDRDPEHSSLAQRFAGEVLEKDTTVREKGLEEKGDASADEEIRNLIAIPIYMENEFEGVVVCVNSQSFDEHADEVLIALGDQAGAVLENSRLHGELRTSYVSTVRMLAEAIEAKDPFLRGHSEEVSAYVARVADRLGVEPRQREELLFGSLLHDIGKIGITERILLKPGPLTQEEFSIIQLHPRIGYRLIRQVPLLRPIAEGVLHHHERYDGGGYPAGLKGEQIPLEARIIGVADAFSAMTSERPYRRRMSLDEACAELERSAGTHFDPQIVRVFVEEVRKGHTPDTEGELSEALADPELTSRLGDEEPLLGYASMAVTDNLTLLYSRRYLHEVAAAEAERAKVQGEPFAVILVELGGLGEINSGQSYAAGDAAIKAAAKTVQSAAVRCGGSASRYGGGCLALLCPGLGETDAREVASGLQSDLPEAVGGHAGVAAWRDGESGEDVIDRARAALTVPA